MKRILTGIQATGVPHLGNITGAIIPSVELIHEYNNQGIYFIADLHSLTSNKDPDVRVKYSLQVAAAWLAFELDTNNNIFFRQSKVVEVCELKWYLDCFTPYPMLANAHSFKDKAENLSDINAGLFTYPVLMAADILLYDADIVPVGKDQLQHLEITRDIAKSFNNKFGDIFTIPNALMNKKSMIIPGIDGRKMSKSYKNTINIFLPENKLKKQIMSIKTDSIPLEKPKNPENCNVFRIYSMLADQDQIDFLRNKYLKGNFGYGEAKKLLLDLILTKFVKQRVLYNQYINNSKSVIDILEKGEKKAKSIAYEKLQQIRDILKY